MEIVDEYWNANEISSEDEEYNDYSEDQMTSGEEEKKDNQLENKEPSSELRKFQISLCEELIRNSKAGKDRSEGGYFDFIFSLCRKWIEKHLESIPGIQASLIMELETFMLLFQSRADPEDEALDPTIFNINEIRKNLLKHTINIDVAKNVYAVDRILDLLKRAKQWQKDTKSPERKDLFEKDIQASLKEFQTSINSLFRSTEKDRLDQCTSLMTELDKLRVSPYWEESIYRHRLMYKQLLWIKQQSYQTSIHPHESADTLQKAVEACNTMLQYIRKTPKLRKNEYGIVDAGYFDRRINEIYGVTEIQSCRIGSEESLYRDLCTILKTVRKLFNHSLQKKNFIVCINQLCESVHKKCQEYFVKLQDEKNNQELLTAFEWLQKTSCLLDEIKNCFQSTETIQKDIQYETKNSNLEVCEAKTVQIWLKFWNAKFAMIELVRKDYQEILRDLETIIGDVTKECIYAKSTELLERASEMKEICGSLIIQVQAEESQINWKFSRKRQIVRPSKVDNK